MGIRLRQFESDDDNTTQKESGHKSRKKPGKGMRLKKWTKVIRKKVNEHL